MTKIVCWNIAKRVAPWRELLDMGVDVALLQEVGWVPDDVAGPLPVVPAQCLPSAPAFAGETGAGTTPGAGFVETGDEEHWSWNRHLYDRWPMVVKLSDRVEVQWFRQTGPVANVSENEIAVSGIGTIAGAHITPLHGGEPFLAFSMYARWLVPHPTTKGKQISIYPDASAHRIISDLSAFIGHVNPSTHRILAAGDLNTIYGATDDHPLAMPDRDRTIFDRMTALGLDMVGPRHPWGRRACPTPFGLPEDTKNVPTYHTTRQTPATAENQLDYVFASRGFHESVKVRALNEVDEWGPSDHCRILIDVADTLPE